MPYQSIGDFAVNFMTNQFNLSNWYDNDESDLNESIDLIKDYDDDMKASNIGSIPPCKNLTPS